MAEQYEAENPGVEEASSPLPLASSGSTAPRAVEDVLGAHPTPNWAGGGQSDTPPTPATSPDAPPPTPPASGRGEEKALASPAVRARAADLGIDLDPRQNRKSDRIRHADLDAFLRYGSGQGYHAPHASHARPDEPIKVIGMRRRIAENMAASKRSIPHFTYVDEIDVTALEAMRADLNDNRGGRPEADDAAAADCGDLQDHPRLPDAQRALRRRGGRGNAARRGASRHGDADRCGADRPRHPRRAGQERVAARDRNPAPCRGGACETN